MSTVQSGDQYRQTIESMARAVQQGWWLFLLRGIAAIVFGILALVWPGLTLFVLIISFGVYVIFDGAVEVWNGFTNREQHDRWWVDVLIGLAGIIAGILIISLPGVTAVVAMYYIGAWMVITGLLQIFSAIKLRQEISGEWFLILTGLLSVVLGIIFFIWPGSGAVSLVWLIAVYAIVFGIILVIFSFRARKGFDV
jgi:uncharacterized membrane protein HdeD (DUF308 family)